MSESSLIDQIKEIEKIVTWIWKVSFLDKDESWNGMMPEDAKKALEKLLHNDEGKKS